MSENQGELPVCHCPACGGLMAKRAGSSFYWHADANHPPCAITNISEPPLAAKETVHPEPPPRKKRQKK